jgi:iron complex outermembrane receptor protein
MEIVVEADRPGKVYDYSLGQDEINSDQPKNTVDLIKNIADLDVVTRGFSQVQNDVMISTGSYEQAAVAIDGIRINDPQTGHYNFDLPLTIFDIENVDVIKNGSSIAGSGGFSGLVNVVTKKAVKDSAEITGGYGSYDTVYSAVSASKVIDQYSITGSFEKSRSNGYHIDTDFDKNTGFLKTGFINNVLTLGYDEKNYGAYDFYTPGANLPSREFVITRFASLFLEPFENASFELYLRTHYDRFILDNTRPDYYQNRHNDSTYGFDIKYGVENAVYKAYFKYNLNRDEIQSSSLGDHYRFKSSGLVNLFARFMDSIDANANLGVEKYHEFGDMVFLPSASATWEVFEVVKLSAGYSYSCRYPDFTELYYSDPVTNGDPDLKPERANEYRAGVESDLGAIVISCDGFYRNAFDLIDWGKKNITDARWQAGNIGLLNTTGITTGLKWPFAIFNFGASYSYINSYASEDYISKYGINYLKNKAEGYVDFNIWEIRTKLSYTYKNYIKRSDVYNNFDIAVSRKIFGYFTVEGKVEDIGNLYFEEVPGIPAAGRMISGSLTAEF